MATISMKLIAVLAAAALVDPVSGRYEAPLAGGAAGFLQARRSREGDAARRLASRLAGPDPEGRLAALEQALHATYAALPKDSSGGLGHQAVRYALHRLFVQRRGWYIKGLEPTAGAANASNKEWVPSFLQSRLERDLGSRGASLRELAALAAALEDVASQESRVRLAEAYAFLGFDPKEKLDQEGATKAATIFYTGFLDAVDLSLAAQRADEAWQRAMNATANYPGWGEAERWLHGVLEPHFGCAADFSFDQVAQMTLQIEERYHEFNDIECRDLKKTMQEIEGHRAGRVRLPAFYKKGLFSHWEFNEKADYLRAIGSLMESDTGDLAPSVIVPNYLSARTNCLDVSSLYALCCRNECEDLLGQLERQVGAPHAPEEQVAELAARLASDTVAAPRELSPALLQRLSRVSTSNGGVVPLHGRLFAQWMHHAFPRECPYPHKAGATSPQTPDEWMQQTGQQAHDLTEEELRAHVEGDTCAAQPGDSYAAPAAGCGGAAEEELPWSETEELLEEPPEPPAATFWLVLLVPFLSGGLALSPKKRKSCMSLAPEVGTSAECGA